MENKKEKIVVNFYPRFLIVSLISSIFWHWKGVFDGYEQGRIICQKNNFGFCKEKKTYIDVYETYLLFIETKIDELFMIYSDQFFEKNQLESEKIVLKVNSTSEFWKLFSESGIAKIEELLFFQNMRQFGRIVQIHDYRVLMSKRVMRMRGKKLKIDVENSISNFFEIFETKKKFRNMDIGWVVQVFEQDDGLEKLFEEKMNFLKLGIKGKFVAAIASLDGFSYFVVD